MILRAKSKKIHLIDIDATSMLLASVVVAVVHSGSDALRMSNKYLKSYFLFVHILFDHFLMNERK